MGEVTGKGKDGRVTGRGGVPGVGRLRRSQREEVTERSQARGRWTSPSLPAATCSVVWAVFNGGDQDILLLVEREDAGAKSFQVVVYNLGNCGSRGVSRGTADSRGRCHSWVRLHGQARWAGETEEAEVTGTGQEGQGRGAKEDMSRSQLWKGLGRTVRRLGCISPGLRIRCGCTGDPAKERGSPAPSPLPRGMPFSLSRKETVRAKGPTWEATGGCFGGNEKLVTCPAAGFLKAQGLGRFCCVLLTCRH